MKSKRLRDKTTQKSVTLYSDDVELIEREWERTGATSFSDALQGIIQRYKKVIARRGIAS